MTGLIIVGIIALVAIVTVQIGRLTELASKIRGEEDVQLMTNRRSGTGLLIFGAVLIVACIWSALHYKNYMLGYGPHAAASAHGGALDTLFNWTLFFTGIVFVATQIALFWFSFQYKGTKKSRSRFFAHDTTLELVWTGIPAIVMTFLVVSGLDAWNEVMADVPEDGVSVLIPQEENEFLEIEATGYQFAWDLRYPGEDGKLGTKNFRKINLANNPLGQDWEDAKNWDDFMPGEIVLPVGKQVRVRITSKDVLHNFYLPHFRVKMDAVPGMPTYFVFTPEVTTEEYRERLKNTPEYNQPDPDSPEKMKWETFDYELACAELCGKGHYSMRRIVKIVPEREYKDWLSKQQSYYIANVRGTDADPNLDKVLPFEIKERKENFNAAVEKAISAKEDSLKIIKLQYVKFETGSASLTANSRYELENLIDVLKRYPALQIEVAGHTDNTGDADANQMLSENRAKAVADYLKGNGGIAESRLVPVGYGQNRPIDTNTTDQGKAVNRRTEFRILTQ